MTRPRSAFAGGDQSYLRDEQYRDASRLEVRARLHQRHSTATTPWHDWVLATMGLHAGDTVLEAGCGPGWLWVEPTDPLPTSIDLTLTDLSPGMVHTAVERVRSSGRVARVDGRAADLQSLPFDAASFDLVVANHMLYHLPDPALGVAELARVVRSDGTVIATTNGQQHLREIWAIRGDVFGLDHLDQTIDVFGAEVAFTLLRRRFADVRWFQYEDEIRCTEPADVLAYICSTPPGEHATDAQRAELVAMVERAFERGGGTMRITKDSGCFVCRSPRI